MASPKKNATRKPPSKPRQEAVEGFWDKPALLNMAADLLFLAGFAGLAWAAVVTLQRLPFFPLRQVVVEGELKQVTRTQVEYAAKGSAAGNFFTVDVDAVRSSFEKLPWVRRVSVRRRWPDTLALELEEQTAVARWRQGQGEYRLVNPRGELFAATSSEVLPVFSGPEGTAPLLLARHQAFTQALAPLGRRPVELALSSREAWQVKLDDGVLLDLGREEAKHPVDERLDRFVAVYRDVGEKLKLKPTLIDMRYPNGFALRAAGKTS